jgi:hypothetical protein
MYSRQEARDAGEEDEAALGRGPGDTHHERQVGDEAVRHAEDRGSQGPGPAAGVPPLAPGDCLGRLGGARLDTRMTGGDQLDRRTPAAPAASLRRLRLAVQPLPDLGVLALVRRDRLHLGVCLLGAVHRLLVALDRLDHVAHGTRPEQPSQGDDDPDPGARTAGGRHRGSKLP